MLDQTGGLERIPACAVEVDAAHGDVGVFLRDGAVRADAGRLRRDHLVARSSGVHCVGHDIQLHRSGYPVFTQRLGERDQAEEIDRFHGIRALIRQIPQVHDAIGKQPASAQVGDHPLEVRGLPWVDAIFIIQMRVATVRARLDSDHPPRSLP